VTESIDRSFIIQQAKQYFNDAKPTHDWGHVLRVHALCMHIGLVENADMDILSCAAYLHDIGRIFEEQDASVCHAEKGVEIAHEILLKANVYTTEFIESVLHCILTHRFRNNNIPTSIEAKILYDADKLDAIGAIGIARAYAYAGEHNQQLVTSFDSFSEDLAVDHNTHSPVKEYNVKLSKIKDKMLTDEGKRIAEGRDAFMHLYFSRLQDEIGGVL